MAKVGPLGAGTLSIIILLVILIVLLILYICKVPAMKYVFWAYFVCFIITLIVLFTMPFESDREDERYNKQFPQILAFGLAILIGLVVSIVLYFYVVLLHENVALVVPNYS